MANATTESTTRGAMGGSLIEVLGGIAAVVLAIIGLARVAPQTMAGWATILVGLALALEGGALAARFRNIGAVEAESRERAQVGSGMTFEVLGGITGIVLGSIALFGIAPLTLIAVANIVFGAALMIGSAGTARLHRETLARPGGTDVVARTGEASSGLELMVGIGAITLGILALLGFVPLVLELVALLAVGLTVLLSGSTIGARFRSMIPHRSA